MDFAQGFCISRIDQFITLGNPDDNGVGDFDPNAFALFVVDMSSRNVTVNVFFDDTILPPLKNGTSSCQVPCGGAANGGNCPCNSTSNPETCLWQVRAPLCVMWLVVWLTMS